MGKTLPSRIAAGIAAAALVLTAFVAVASPANAEGNPADPTNPATPATVTDDALPTPQIDGVVWQQKISGNTVFVGGNFQTARPFGSASGVNTVPRTDLLSYNLTTGVLNTGFAPTLNGQVKALALSSDGSTLYIGGTFTTVNGVARSRIAALNASTGALITSWNPSPNYTVAAIAVSGSTVYFGGGFSSVGKTTAADLAAVDATTGAVKTGWLPQAAGGSVTALAVSPDGTKVVIGGAFTTLNGSSNPGYGLAEVDATTGALLPFAVNGLIRDAGTQSSITSLASDADGVYGSGYVFGAGGDLEGSFRASWTGGNITWIEDCHGDTYSVATTADAEYVAGHPHYCGNIGGFPQTSPTWTFHRGLAFSKAATQTITADPYGYYNYAGNPAPSLQNWFPDFNVGTFTGQSQGPWSVATSADSNYVVYGGEFTTINGIQQQGLVRFAVKSIAPNKMGPKNSGANFVPTLTSVSSGSVRVAWTANWDPDSTNLTYNVYRNGDMANPVYTTTQASNVYTTPQMGFVDTGLTPGSTASYRIRATDSDGNTVIGDGVSITVSSATPSAYTQSVLAQGATNYWPLNEASGSTEYDNAGFSDQTIQGAGVTRGAAGSSSDGSTASTFSGASTAYSATTSKVTGPQVFSEEAWFNTTSTAGGKIVGFGDQNTTLSSNYDRHIYMTTDGKINFGVYNNNSYVLTSPTALNDGKWHQVVGELSSAGMALYIDGKKVASGSNTGAQPFSGYWRIGGDSSWSGSNFFAGSIDNVSIYPTALTQSQVNGQYVAAGYPSQLNSAPSDAYGSQVFTDSPVLYFRLGDAAGSTTAADASLTNTPGVVSGGVTFGQPGAISGTSNTAASFDGSSGEVASAQQFSDPEVYSEEAWFKTTTTTGGKIMGFGDAQSGLSSNYDRHIYMQDNGQLVFGVWTGQTNTITTPGSYNDGNWHYVVATQSSAGLALYVDGNLIGTNPDTQAQAYSGYWKIGGDPTWGSSSPYFNGTIDEAAVYDHALSASTVSAHYALGQGQTANKAPTASFTSSVSTLKASFDASASSDSDGSIASYAWDFGDGSTGSGVTPTHTYAKAGTYTVTLTVTDNSGATGTQTSQVSVTAPVNQPPTASFTSTISNLQVAFDGTGSSDADGTVASYAWDFGDGSSATGATANHTYAAAGTYTVKLTVTDNQGATGTSSAQVTVVAPHVNQPPTAAIATTISGLQVSVDGTGSSDADGTVASYAWNFGDGATATTPTASHTYVAGGTYTVTLTVTDNSGATGTATTSVTVAAPNQAPVATMTLGTSALVLSADGSASKDPDGTIASYAWNFGDGGTATTKTASHTYAAAGTYTVTLTVTDNQGATGTSSQTVAVTKAPNVLPTASFNESASNLKVSVDGTSSTDPDGTVQSYAWNFGDGSSASGATASHSYASAGTYKITLTVTDNDGGTGSSSQNVTVTAPANQPPVAAFTTSVSGLTVNADGSTSSDPDGTVASYAWNFGDGSTTATATGKTASHTFASAGTYTVSLTVTDNGGATNTTTSTVTVTAPTAQPFDLDSFARTVSNGWGTADQGGAWAATGTASVLSVSGGNGVIANTKVGATNGAQLMTTKTTSTDLRAQFSLDKAATGGGTYVYISGRRIDSNNEYRATLRFSSTGTAVLSLSSVVGGTVTSLGNQVAMPGTFTAGTPISFRMQVSGTAPTTIKLKAWITGTTEPSSWLITQTDSTPALQAAGGIAIQSYLSASATNAPQKLMVSQLSALPVQ